MIDARVSASSATRQAPHQVAANAYEVLGPFWWTQSSRLDLPNKKEAQHLGPRCITQLVPDVDEVVIRVGIVQHLCLSPAPTECPLWDSSPKQRRGEKQAFNKKDTQKYTLDKKDPLTSKKKRGPFDPMIHSKETVTFQKQKTKQGKATHPHPWDLGKINHQPKITKPFLSVSLVRVDTVSRV